MFKNILKTILIISTFNTYAGLPPTTLSGQSASTQPTTFNFKTPYNQSTSLGGINSLIETGSENMLVNPGFEAVDNGSTPSGWTCTTGTCTTEKTIFSSGKQSMKVVPVSNIFDISQQITTPANIQKQGAVGILYSFPATCTTPVIEVSVDGTVQNTVPTTNLVLDGLFHLVEVPTVFGATSAKLRSFSTATCTGNIYFDAAYIKQGIGYQNLMLDNVYSAIIANNGTTATITSVNKAGWLTSATRTATGKVSLAVPTGIFNQNPACVCTTNDAGGTVADCSIDTTLLSTTNISTVQSTSASNPDKPFTITCQKQGNDYLNSSANVYTASSANFGQTAYSPAITGVGTISTPSTNYCLYSREGQYLDMECRFTTGTTTATTFQVPLPGSLTVASTYTAATLVGKLTQNSVSVANYDFNIIALPGTSYLALGEQSTNNGLTTVNGSLLASTVATSLRARVAITGWSNSNYIIGLFAGYGNLPGYQGGVDLFKVSYGATATTVCSTGTCAYLSQPATSNAVSSITVSGTTYTMNTSKTYKTMDCVVVGISPASSNAVGRINSQTPGTAFTFTTLNTSATAITSYGTLDCTGTY